MFMHVYNYISLYVYYVQYLQNSKLCVRVSSHSFYALPYSAVQDFLSQAKADFNKKWDTPENVSSHSNQYRITIVAI